MSESGGVLITRDRSEEQPLLAAPPGSTIQGARSTVTVLDELTAKPAVAFNSDLPKRLYHYTCSHSIRPIIADRNVLRPNDHPGIQPMVTELARQLGDDHVVRALPVIWLTDIDVRSDADVEAIGLQGIYVSCDRVEHRFRVPRSASIQWWPTWADCHVTDPEWRKLLELERRPDHWWISEVPIPGARLDERYGRP